MDCMDANGLDRNDLPSYEVQANIVNEHTPRLGGLIRVTFHSGQHSPFGPSIEMQDVIKGYGIPYTEFKPKFQRFEYSEAENTLTVSGSGYCFSIWGFESLTH